MNKEYLSKILKIFIFITSIVGLLSIVLEYGFYLSSKYKLILHDVSIAVIILYMFYHIAQFILSEKKKSYLILHKIEVLLISLILLETILYFFNLSIVKQISRFLNFKNIAFLYVVFAQIFIVLGLIFGGLWYNNEVLQLKIHPSRLFVMSFMITIAIGTILLMLPASTVLRHMNFIDALFTSTSAVCVTGLTSVDTSAYFTTFGKFVIMGLFQIGGLGLMTLTTFFALFLSGSMGIRGRLIINDILGEENIGAVSKVLVIITTSTFFIELIGAGLLFVSVYQSFPNYQEALFFSIFHSISAFCNAGFSLLSLNLMDPLVQNNFLFTFTISLLIVIGGLGFPTLMSVKYFRKHKGAEFSVKRIPLQARIVVSTTVLLIIVGTLFFYFSEVNNTLKNLTFFEKLSASYFQSVTSRTAGFNTLDFGQMGVPIILFFLFLMFVGASPGGTGGGIKTTTFAILIISSWQLIKEKKHVTMKNRTIPQKTVLGALLKTFLSISIISTGIFILTIFEEKSLIDLTFEAFSAFGTVGLSRGITSSLSEIGKLVIILLMLIGRVGPLAFIYSIIKTREIYELDLPTEDISIL
ncbi:MAG: ATPase [Ignavibacteriales bacterium CG_4_9_14_3_um_filter_34_10]|nr:MAG: ATPase [Ignavibacteriales bacterium CG_4_9_14_3_um_filter_34_10]